jgi:hypothetical protein
MNQRAVGETMLIVDEMGGRGGCSDGGVGESMAVVTMFAKTAQCAGWLARIDLIT